jgi:hypothetical protein
MKHKGESVAGCPVTDHVRFCPQVKDTTWLSFGPLETDGKGSHVAKSMAAPALSSHCGMLVQEGPWAAGRWRPP